MSAMETADLSARIQALRERKYAASEKAKIATIALTSAEIAPKVIALPS
jgi:hypothetical protein